MSATKAPFRARLLGQLSVIRPDGTQVEFPTIKTRALFALIVASGSKGIDRSVAASMLWSRGSDTQARTNLRQTLAGLRKALGAEGDVILSQGSVLRADDTALLSDIWEVEHGELSSTGTVFDDAGEFLEGLSLPEPDFTDWLTRQRTTYRNALSTLLFDTAERLLDQDRVSEALAHNTFLLRLDEYDEGAHRQAMRILSTQGGAGRAILHFENLTRLLKDELGVAPSQATADLAASLRASGAAVSSESPLPSPAATISGPNPITRVAILGFEALTEHGDTGFGSGLVEDITTGLARFKTIRLHRLSNEADYVVQGTTRHAGNRIRVSVQLTRVATGNVVWAERYDRELGDMFEVQDDLARSIVAALPGRIQADANEAALHRDIGTLSAHELMLRGKALRDKLSADAMLEARPILERAVELDPDCARAFMYLSDTYVVDHFLGLGGQNTADLALDYARQAVAADSTDVFIQDHLGFAFLTNAMWSEGEAQIARTLALIENEVESNAWCAYALLLLGNHDGALSEVHRSTPRDPVPPPTFGWIRGQVFSFNGDDTAAANELMGAALLNSLAWAFLAGAQARLGRRAEAETALQGFITHRTEELTSRGMRAMPQNIETLAEGFRPIWRRPEDFAHIADGLKLAGLPD